jgi:hypothetical protein
VRSVAQYSIFEPAPLTFVVLPVLLVGVLAWSGIMPVQMSYTGLNFDIVTGATAIPVALLAATGRAGPRLIAAWNVVGLGLLVNVVTVAILRRRGSAISATIT